MTIKYITICGENIRMYENKSAAYSVFRACQDLDMPTVAMYYDRQIDSAQSLTAEFVARLELERESKGAV